MKKFAIFAIINIHNRMDIRIFPPEDMIEATVNLPLSKSIINRLLIINALSGAAPDCRFAEQAAAASDDCRLLASALDALRAGEKTVNVGAAGTAMRFLTAFIACDNGIVPCGTAVTLDGNERMRNRPIGELVDALRSLGAEIRYTEREGFPPLEIKSRKLSGGDLTVDASISSQYISALMMIAPTLSSPLTITLKGEAASRPYITMTEELMKRFGVAVDFQRYTIEVVPEHYNPQGDMSVEPDWSAASYWYAIAALSAGFITLADMKLPSIQGDSRCAELSEMLGVTTSDAMDCDEEDCDDATEPVDGLMICPSPEQFSRFEVDLYENPDLAQTFAVAAAMLGIPFHLRGLSTLRIKETDRLQAMRTEMDKLGFIVEIRNGSELVWNGERHPIFEIPAIDTYGDHRMAMAFAPAAVFVPGLMIRNAEVVSKSYPVFWDDMRSAGFTIVDAASADAPDLDPTLQQTAPQQPDSKVL